MKRLSLVACGIALSTSALAGCVGWPEANRDVKELQSLIQQERKFLEPKDPTHTAAIKSLDARIDSCLESMDKLTR